VTVDGTYSDLANTVHRWRAIVYAIATSGMVAFAAVRPDWRGVAAGVLFAAGCVLSTGRFRSGLFSNLLLDLVVSVSLWWWYGPVSGAALITFAVVSVGPFLLDRRRSLLVVVTALITVPAQIALHFIAGMVHLPLFHPAGPVATSEFLTGQAIQAGLIFGVGFLMIRIAAMLREGQEALAADLDRERELNTLKDRFVATVSHQLRTPLTSLKGFTRALLENDSDPAERKEFLTIMSDQAEELHALIEDLITFSRIGAGGPEITSAVVDLHALAESVLAGFGARAEMVSNQVPPGTLVLGDSPRLHQVMRNLVDNALKYGEPPIVIEAESREAVVRCQVLDAGAGIDPVAANLAFEPYGRLIEDLTMSSPGLGLGLPIVRELIRAHGGEVALASRDAMTGFEFTLPSPATEATAVETVAVKVSPLR
jgi:signal transduction histidine kinase